MKLNRRRITVGLISTAVVVAMTSVTTWALAADDKAALTATNQPVRLVIGYKAGADRTAATRTLSAAGARLTAAGPAQTALSEIRASRVTVSPGRRASMMAALRSDPNVAYVEQDVRTQAFDLVPNDPTFSKQNEMYTVRAPQAWSTTTGGPSAVTVAVIDTGVAAVGDLAGATVAGYDFVNNDSNAADDRGHGTSVAALIAARGNNTRGMAGVCWTCKIMPVKVLDAKGSGYDSDVAQGIIWAVQHGAKILNLSLGGSNSSKVLADAVAYANMNSVLVVAAAGNAGNTKVQFPAAYPDVLTVAATNRCPSYATTPACTTDTATRSSYSSYNAAGAAWVDVAAPGKVMTMDRSGNYNTGVEGTSFAAPIVSGAAALVKAKNPSYTGWSLASSIYTAATKRKLTNGGVNYGLIDIPASLNVPTDRTPPTASGITPATGSIKRGTFAVSPVNLKDDRSGIKATSLWVNGTFRAASRNAPFGISYNFSSFKGATKVELRIFDKAGNYKIITNTLTIDNTLPATKITSAPKNKSKVKGQVTIKYTGSDQYGMSKYQLLLNGKVAQTHTSTTPFVFAATAAPKSFTVQVRGYDKAGNSRLSTKFSYTR